MMKKLAAVVFGLSLVLGAATVTWSDDDHDKKDHKDDKKHDSKDKDKKKHT